MKQIFINKPLLSGLMASVFSLTSASAQATIVNVLDENFDDGSNTTIESLLTTTPTALPTGSSGSSTTTAASVNLRLGTDAINTYNAGNPLQRFALSSGTNFFYLPPLLTNSW